MNQTAKKKPRLRIRLLTMNLSVAMSLLLCEAALRIWNPIRIPVRSNQIVLPVRTRLVEHNTRNRKADRVIVNTYNGLGFRGPEKPDHFVDRLTIVTVGGSTTACISLSDGKTWPDILFDRLRLQHPEIWLNNAGFDGHSTFGHLQLLRQFLAGLRPDIILYLVGVNEVGRSDLGAYDAELDPNKQSFRNRIVAKSELLSTIQVLWRTLRAIELNVVHKDIDFAALPRLETPTATTDSELEGHRRRYIPEYRRRLEGLLSETVAAGIRPVLLTQPALYGNQRDPTLGLELGHLAFNGTFDAATQWRVLELYNDVTREVAATSHTAIIDLASKMPKDSRFYFDWTHFSNDGARQVAAIVADGLLPILEGVQLPRASDHGNR